MGSTAYVSLVLYESHCVSLSLSLCAVFALLCLPVSYGYTLVCLTLCVTEPDESDVLLSADVEEEEIGGFAECYDFITQHWEMVTLVGIALFLLHSCFVATAVFIDYGSYTEVEKCESFPPRALRAECLKESLFVV